MRVRACVNTFRPLTGCISTQRTALCGRCPTYLVIIMHKREPPATSVQTNKYCLATSATC